MGVFSGPDIKEDGLVLALDGANYKSFKGEATTNLIPSPTVNAYPTTGNGWGTYNTNQYGSGTYFSIGTVNDVTNNIITMTSAHSLRTYDVMNPQTTGGGVTAGTNYFIKKVSSTSFTLHAYNGSEDGSQGYINPSTGNHKVYDSIANDTRISVNSTSFPTMWYGYAHQPNSGLVKELRYGEFNAIPNLPANDCIRLHYIRTDDVKDGMAYGVDCVVTPSSPVTVSFYTRSANANAVGKVVQYYIYNYIGGNATAYSWNFTLGPVGVWQRQTFTYTPANQVMISYWFPQSSGTYAWDWSCMQVEQKSYVTNFVAGTRGTTVSTGGGWADLTGIGNNGTLVNGVRESSDNLGALVFDGTNDYISSNSGLTNNSDFSVSFWIKYQDSLVSNRGLISSWDTSWNGFGIAAASSSGIRSWTNNGAGGGMNWDALSTIQNRWAHLTLTYTFSDKTQRGYINAVFKNSESFGSTISHSTLQIGRGGQTSSTQLGLYPYANCLISNVQAYNRALTAAEISQNFNANRSRYGI